MVIIALTATNRTASFFYTRSKVTVNKQVYPNSKLFHSYNHEIASLDLSPIEICKDDITCTSKKIIINRSGLYSDKALNNAHVYYNEYDNGYKNPLILVLFFEESTFLKNKYYKASVFNSLLTSIQSVELSSLENYENQNDLIEDLLKENDLLAEPLTYDINRISGDQGNDLYNNNKIKIENDTSSGYPKITFLQFTRYKHTPQKTGVGKKACVIFNKNVLLSSGKEELSGIQNQKYDYIRVYYSDSVTEPLLLELCTQSSKPNTNVYYYHTRDTDGSLIWKKINVNDTVLTVKFDHRDIYSQLSAGVVTKFQGLLNHLRSNLPKIIVFMVDYKQREYELTTITRLFSESSKYKLINKKTKVTDKTDSSEGNCINKYGFRVYEHDFTETASIMDSQKAQLRFILPKSSGTSYSQITLYDNVRTTHQDVKVLEYNPLHKQLYVYFCGSDTRPLLICYPGSGYKPKDTESYSYSWVKDSNISKCVCQNTGGQNTELLKALFEAVRILNPVNLYNVGEYSVQNFNKIDIKIKVITSELTCYNKYEHTHINKIYKLGNIGYNVNRKSGTLSYEKLNKQSFITYVATYFYKHDTSREFPLIVELKFNEEYEKIYYKLKTANTKYQWDQDPSLNERSLLDELFKLNKKFNKNKNPNEDECNPSNNTSAIAGGVTTTVILGGGGVAAGVLYYKYPEQILSLISKIIRR